MFHMPEVRADQPAQKNPTNQNIDQPVVAPDIIQMGNVVAPEPAIKERHIDENSNRTAVPLNMAKVVQLTKGNISFETAKAFKLQIGSSHHERWPRRDSADALQCTLRKPRFAKRA
jgi:hypothetical protein